LRGDCRLATLEVDVLVATCPKARTSSPTPTSCDSSASVTGCRPARSPRPRSHTGAPGCWPTLRCRDAPHGGRGRRHARPPPRLPAASPPSSLTAHIRWSSILGSAGGGLGLLGVLGGVSQFARGCARFRAGEWRKAGRECHSRVS
jgi:hypothetical protein